MSSPTDLDCSVKTLLIDAAEWRLLARLLECPCPGWRDEVTALSREISAAPLRAVAQLAGEHASEGLYHSVFGPGGPAPPREASYLRTLELGSLLASIEGDYDAFAYRPEGLEPPDHVAVETGFIAYLRLKEAYALASGQHQAARVARRTAERFLSDHLAVVAHPLSELLAESGIDYLSMAASLVATRSGARPVRRELPVIQPDGHDDDSAEALTCDL